MKRKHIVAGNWKMNKNFLEGILLANNLLKELELFKTDVEIVLGTPFIHLHTIAALVKDKSNVNVAAQNCYPEPSGAYTGEISVGMIHSTGAQYVIIGHSERCQYFAETDEFVAKKVKAVLDAGLMPIFCCGEPLEVRKVGEYNEYVAKQIENSLFGLTQEEMSRVVIAYEPIWAIGTGRTATPEQAQSMHEHIRSLIAGQFSAEIADACTILYGGSCKPSNAWELFEKPDVDGALVGGASLKADAFAKIIKHRTDIR